MKDEQLVHSLLSHVDNIMIGTNYAAEKIAANMLILLMVIYTMMIPFFDLYASIGWYGAGWGGIIMLLLSMLAFSATTFKKAHYIHSCMVEGLLQDTLDIRYYLQKVDGFNAYLHTQFFSIRIAFAVSFFYLVMLLCILITHAQG